MLADRGLVEAIENRVARLPIRVEVACGPGVRDGRFERLVEGAAYFLVCEALANTLKHGTPATRPSACGWSPTSCTSTSPTTAAASTRTGSARRAGWPGSADRLSALGGSFEVPRAPAPAPVSRPHCPAA